MQYKSVSDRWQFYLLKKKERKMTTLPEFQWNQKKNVFASFVLVLGNDLRQFFFVVVSEKPTITQKMCKVSSVRRKVR